MLEILLASAGFAALVKYKRPYKDKIAKIPIINEGVECSLCLGFWLGLGVLLFSEMVISEHWYLPLATAGFSWIVDSIVDLIQTAAVLLDSKNE
jgi:hypothetical protein